MTHKMTQEQWLSQELTSAQCGWLIEWEVCLQGDEAVHWEVGYRAGTPPRSFGRPLGVLGWGLLF